MTKLRPPLTVEAAINRISGQLPGSVEQMAQICGRRPSTVRAWADPGRPEEIPIDCAIRLDRAYAEAGGQGFPLFEVYSHLVKSDAAEAFASKFSLLNVLHDCIREGGEAEAAIVRAALPEAGSIERRNAVQEVEQAIVALSKALTVLNAPEVTPAPS